MGISIIAAMDSNGLIGSGLHLPWNLPSDLRRFRKLTWGKPVVMGRKTFESLKKPLPGRINIVLSRQADYEAKGCQIYHSLIEAIDAAGKLSNDNEIMIIGGAEVFRQALSFADRFYRTTVLEHFTGDTFFPTEQVIPHEWKKIHSEHIPACENSAFAHDFEILERVRYQQGNFSYFQQSNNCA